MSVMLTALCLALAVAEASKSLFLSPAQPWTGQPVAYGPLLLAGLLGAWLARLAPGRMWSPTLHRLLWMCTASVLLAWMGVGIVLYPRASVGAVLGTWRFMLREWAVLVLVSVVGYLVVRFFFHPKRSAREAT